MSEGKKTPQELSETIGFYLLLASAVAGAIGTALVGVSQAMRAGRFPTSPSGAGDAQVNQPADPPVPGFTPEQKAAATETTSRPV